MPPNPQRVDLNTEIPQTPAPGQQYGQGVAQQAAIRAVPLKLPPTMPGQDIAQPTSLSAPTQRPQEPLTAGASFGPGPGPESLFTAPQSMTPSPAARLLTYLASLPTATPEIQRLAYAAGQPVYSTPANPDDAFDALGR